MQHLARLSRALLPRLSAAAPAAGYRSLPRSQLSLVPTLAATSSSSLLRPLFLQRCLATAKSSSSSSHDAKLSSLLESELQYERSSGQQQQQQPQPPEGFTVTARNGTLLTLTRQCPEDGSLLEVSFDLNGSTSSPDIDEQEDDSESGSRADRDASEDAEADEEILSRPDLTFRVRKPAAKSCLAVRCSFPPVQISRQMATEEPDYPTLSIDTVAIEGEAGLGNYELEADMLNDDLYKQLAEMLVHRGVTRDFEHNLVQYCTSEEHGLYLRFLGEAKKFCDA